MSTHLFIAGLPSSGTTAVKDALAALRFASVVGPFQDGSDDKRYPKCVVEPIDGRYTTEQELAIKKWLARYDKGGWVIEKTPSHYRSFVALQTIFPEAYFICLQRNPFHIICSQRRRWDGYGTTDKVTFQRFDKESTRTIAKLKLMLDFIDTIAPNLNRFSWVRYEELCHSPQRVIRQIMKFLDVRVSDRQITRAAKSVKRNPRTYNPDMRKATRTRQVTNKLYRIWKYT